jgi:SpoVK/Ycf46/Vps4 family AAA+-type ATPase
VSTYDDIVYVFATTNRLDAIDVALLRKVSHFIFNTLPLFIFFSNVYYR